MPPEQQNDLLRRATSGRAAGVIAGCVGGLIASWLMVKFQRRVWPPPEGDDGEPSTTRLVQHVSRLAGRERLSDDRAQIAGESVHYALGAALGATYGAIVQSKPVAAAGVGLPFGLATEIVFDQLLVPGLGLSKPFWKCPLSWHVRGLAAHMVFGVTSEATRRSIMVALQYRSKLDRSKLPESRDNIG